MLQTGTPFHSLVIAVEERWKAQVDIGLWTMFGLGLGKVVKEEDKTAMD